MDPFTQGALGAAAVLSWERPKKAAMYVTAGWLGGMAADLDVLITSKSDPLLFLEYHRHFTHSIAFIPFGGAIVGFLLWALIFRFWQHSLKSVIIASTIGYATHGLLDACTTYGTQLWWPFSNTRVAWNAVAIIDPFYTLPLFLGIVLTMWLGPQKWVRAAFVYSLMYLGFGILMGDLAEREMRSVTEARGHKAERLSAKPTFLNLFLWRTIYEYDGKFFVDAVRIRPFQSNKVYEGSSTEKVSAPPSTWLEGSTIAKDFERFRWFSNDYLIAHPKLAGVIGDVRYSMIPNRIEPLWGIEPELTKPENHVAYVVSRPFAIEDRQLFWRMLWALDLEASK